MKTFVLLVALSLVAFQQEPPEFPEGVSCSPAGVMQNGAVMDPSHPCHCKRMQTPAPDGCCDGVSHVQEDPMCSQYCHKDHCSCAVICALHPDEPAELRR